MGNDGSLLTRGEWHSRPLERSKTLTRTRAMHASLPPQVRAHDGTAVVLTTGWA